MNRALCPPSERGTLTDTCCVNQVTRSLVAGVEGRYANFNDSDSCVLTTNAFPDQKAGSDKERGGRYLRL